MADETTATTDALAGVAAAVTGPGSPNNASVSSHADPQLVQALILAGPALSLMVMGIVAIFTLCFWPDIILSKQWDLAKIILGAMATLCNIMAGLLGLVIWRLASGGLKSVRAQALGGSLEVASGGE